MPSRSLASGEYAHARAYFYNGISTLHSTDNAGNGLSIGQEVLTHAFLGMDGRHWRQRELQSTEK